MAALGMSILSPVDLLPGGEMDVGEAGHTSTLNTGFLG
jgi:hypothetical protein